jgi:hypothetical protein
VFFQKTEFRGDLGVFNCITSFLLSTFYLVVHVCEYKYLVDLALDITGVKLLNEVEIEQCEKLE